MHELYQIPLFEGISEAELQWLLDHSHEVQLQPGDCFFRENEPVSQFYVVLEGELQVTRSFNGNPTVLGTTPRGIMGGEMDLLNGSVSHVNACTILPSRLMVFETDDFRQLFAACPLVGTRILQTTAQRMAGIATATKNQEKMAALGKLSAGLAHELNNPAAAAHRAAKTLHEALPALQAHALNLNSVETDSRQLERLAAFQQQVIQRAAAAPTLRPLQQADREEEIGEWLDRHGVAQPWEMAATFVSAGLTIDDLAELIEPISAECKGDVLAWLHNSLYVAGLLNEIEHSTQRISELVAAVKAYTYMDQAPVQEVDIHQGLENTLTMLNHKLKKVTVIREYDPDLPLVRGRGGELNQVWTNLIDNAVDAINGEGKLWLITRCENNFAMVEIADNGPGIPPEVMPRLFEPFFTTKEVGVGSGLGLDIVYRIVSQHDGSIDVQSEPGHTRFIVRLPLEGPKSS
ncbi:MAG: sensor histidine kinase [Chloroflexota bacterium]|nr:MAG: sensor histidine kinase [Chloroflexota bacterium]